MKKTLIQKLTISIFILFIFLFSIANIFYPKKDYSENENRTLASFPSTTMKSLFGGSFDDLFETYFSDHFIKRDTWIELKAAYKKATGSLENNHVYYGKNDKLIRSFQSYDKRSIDQNISIINEFATANNIQANILIVPTASIQNDALPTGAYNVDQKELENYLKENFPNQNYIELYDDLSASKDLYYSTDHHWNELGANIAYNKIAQNVLNKEPNAFHYELVNDSFYGTMYSRSGAFWVKTDSIYKIDPEEEISVKVTYDESDEESSIYSEKRLNEKDKYMYYLDGNHSHVSITTSSKSKRKAIIIQDSYAHILIPYLVTEYEQIEVFDPRYYHDSVSSFIDEDTDVYFIYSMDNFAEDKNLVFLK